MSQSLRKPSEEHEAIVAGCEGEKEAEYTHAVCAAMVSSDVVRSGVHCGVQVLAGLHPV